MAVLRPTEVRILEKMRDVLIVLLIASFIWFAVYVAVHVSERFWYLVWEMCGTGWAEWAVRARHTKGGGVAARGGKPNHQRDRSDDRAQDVVGGAALHGERESEKYSPIKLKLSGMVRAETGPKVTNHIYTSD